MDGTTNTLISTGGWHFIAMKLVKLVPSSAGGPTSSTRSSRFDFLPTSQLIDCVEAVRKAYLPKNIQCQGLHVTGCIDASSTVLGPCPDEPLSERLGGCANGLRQSVLLETVLDNAPMPTPVFPFQDYKTVINHVPQQFLGSKDVFHNTTGQD
jgi:hypothetical protein